MVSDGEEFHIYIPSKNQFLVGATTLTRHSNKPIENLRPNHIVEALFWPELMPDKNVLFEQFDLDQDRYYILTLVRKVAGEELETARKIWFDRADLRVSRMQVFGAVGQLDSTSPIRTGSLPELPPPREAHPWLRSLATRATSRSGVLKTITSSKSTS